MALVGAVLAARLISARPAHEEAEAPAGVEASEATAAGVSAEGELVGETA